MQINISVRHGQISDATREKVAAKVAKLSRYFERLTAIHVTIDMEHPETPGVELLVSAEHKHDFVAADAGENMLTCVENVVQKVEQQLRRYKEKIQGHRFTSTGEAAAEAQTKPRDEPAGE